MGGGVAGDQPIHRATLQQCIDHLLELHPILEFKCVLAGAGADVFVIEIPSITVLSEAKETDHIAIINKSGLTIGIVSYHSGEWVRVLSGSMLESFSTLAEALILRGKYTFKII